MGTLTCRHGLRAVTILVALSTVAGWFSLRPGRASDDRAILERLLPAPKNGGFRMDGYYIWCGSVIRVGESYHLFASRWPESTGFPEGYRSHSEIVRAISDRPEGPYEFQEVVVNGRGGDWWDGKMCHNPKIVKLRDGYLLYYIGSAQGSPLRKVGYATAPAITGPWKRIEQPLPLGDDANNPAPYIRPDGSVLLLYRDRTLRMYVAEAPSYAGPYRIVASDIFPGIRLEDPDLYFQDGLYHMVLEDNEGRLTGDVRHGAHLISKDGVRWDPATPIKVYTHTIMWDDGTSTLCTRRERPELFNARASIKGNGAPTHLITGVFAGGQAWCVVQPIEQR
jgi:hypothetical protein